MAHRAFLRYRPSDRQHLGLRPIPTLAAELSWIENELAQFPGDSILEHCKAGILRRQAVRREKRKNHAA